MYWMATITSNSVQVWRQVDGGQVSASLETENFQTIMSSIKDDDVIAGCRKKGRHISGKEFKNQVAEMIKMKKRMFELYQKQARGKEYVVVKTSPFSWNWEGRLIRLREGEEVPEGDFHPTQWDTANGCYRFQRP